MSTKMGNVQVNVRVFTGFGLSEPFIYNNLCVYVFNVHTFRTTTIWSKLVLVGMRGHFPTPPNKSAYTVPTPKNVDIETFGT